ncbi:hypothetical protein JD844_017221, partial [Phrynosoma platyrhinos]
VQASDLKSSHLSIYAFFVALQVFISTRSGSWVMSRVDDKGYPWDTIFHTRFSNVIRNSLPWFLLKWVTEQKMNQWFNHENYGLVPRNRSLMKEPVFNDDLPSRILCGAVTVKPLIKEFTETSAIFEDGSVEENVDVVIFATGYSVAFPFVDKSVIEVADNRVPLYKHVFPPHLEKATLAVIGLIQPLGPIMPTSELQARWATRVFKGLSSLPSASTMMADIIKRNEKRIKCQVAERDNKLQRKPLKEKEQIQVQKMQQEVAQMWRNVLEVIQAVQHRRKVAREMTGTEHQPGASNCRMQNHQKEGLGGSPDQKGPMEPGLPPSTVTAKVRQEQAASRECSGPRWRSNQKEEISGKEQRARGPEWPHKKTNM